MINNKQFQVSTYDRRTMSKRKRSEIFNCWSSNRETYKVWGEKSSQRISSRIKVKWYIFFFNSSAIEKKIPFYSIPMPNGFTLFWSSNGFTPSRDNFFISLFSVQFLSKLFCHTERRWSFIRRCCSRLA